MAETDGIVTGEDRAPRRGVVDSPGWSPSALVSGLALVGSGLLPWMADGPGSSYRGVELAAALGNSDVLPDGARAAGVVVLAVALIGVLHLATLANVGRTAVIVRGVTGLFVVVLVVAIAVMIGTSMWGAGLWSAAVGGAVATVSCGYRLLSRRRTVG